MKDIKIKDSNKKQLFPNVAWLSGCGVVVFCATLGAALFVGVLESGYGCGGGTVGAMIPVAAGVIGYLAGTMNKFADKDGEAAAVVHEEEVKE